MPVTRGDIKAKLEKELSTVHLEVEDLSDGCGTKFKAIIVSPQFEGKTLLQQHRLVNSVIEEEMKDIHAFEMKTMTPSKWETAKAGQS
ncbi:hypothetical protein ScPMuIL_006364 [Solemya velum]